MTALVAAGFTRREILDERRPGRPYLGWSLREFHYWAAKVQRHSRDMAADALDAARVAMTSSLASAGFMKRDAAQRVVQSANDMTSRLRARKTPT